MTPFGLIWLETFFIPQTMISRRYAIAAPLLASLPEMLGLMSAQAAQNPGTGVAAQRAPRGAPAASPARRMPALFIGHGSPMNAISDNEYTRAVRAWGAALPQPRAILMVSAHWLSDGRTEVLAHPRPETIHDFRGFPRELHEMQYPAPGHPALAHKAHELIENAARRTALTQSWGFDHGTWSVLVHLFPQAQVPVFKVSIDMSLPGAEHWAIGRDLSALRDQGVMIVGSGNIVHNLRRNVRGIPAGAHASHSWAQEFDDEVARALAQRDDNQLQSYGRMRGSDLAVPTPDHYWPLLYIAGAAEKDGPPKVVHQSFEHGNISMRSLQFG